MAIAKKQQWTHGNSQETGNEPKNDYGEEVSVVWTADKDCGEEVSNVWIADKDRGEEVSDVWIADKDCGEEVSNIWTADKDCGEEVSWRGILWYLIQMVGGSC